MTKTDTEKDNHRTAMARLARLRWERWADAESDEAEEEDGNAFTCEVCGETDRAALSKDSLSDRDAGAVRCRNCASDAKHTPHPRGECPLCGRAGVPLERHHVAGKANHATLTIVCCLNCHAHLSLWQTQRRAAGIVHHAPLAILQGVADILTLAWERSPYALALRSVGRMLLDALCALAPTLASLCTPSGLGALCGAIGALDLQHDTPFTPLLQDDAL